MAVGMMNDVYNVYPDNARATVYIKATQGETKSRTVTFYLYTSNSQPFIPDSPQVFLWVKKNDGYAVCQTCSCDGNVVTCTLNYQATTCSGENEVILQILQGTQGEVRFSNIILDVAKADIDNVLSQSDFSAVSNLLKNSEAIQNQFNSAEYITEKAWRFAQQTFNEYALDVVPYLKAENITTTNYFNSPNFHGAVGIDSFGNIVSYMNSCNPEYDTGYEYTSTDRGVTFDSGNMSGLLFYANGTNKIYPTLISCGDYFFWFAPRKESCNNTVQNYFVGTAKFENGKLKTYCSSEGNGYENHNLDSYVLLRGADEDNAVCYGKECNNKVFVFTINTSAVYLPQAYTISNTGIPSCVQISMPSADMVCHDVAYDVGKNKYYFAGGYTDTSEKRTHTWIRATQNPFADTIVWENPLGSTNEWTDGRRQCMLSYLYENVYCFRGNETSLRCNPNNGTMTENFELSAPFGRWKHQSELGYDLFLCEKKVDGNRKPYIAYVKKGNITQNEPRTTDVFTELSDTVKNTYDVYMACCGRLIAVQCGGYVHLYNVDYIGDTYIRELKKSIKNVNDTQIQAEDLIDTMQDALAEAQQKIQSATTQASSAAAAAKQALQTAGDLTDAVEQADRTANRVDSALSRIERVEPYLSTAQDIIESYNQFTSSLVDYSGTFYYLARYHASTCFTLPEGTDPDIILCFCMTAPLSGVSYLNQIGTQLYHYRTYSFWAKTPDAERIIKFGSSTLNNISPLHVNAAYPFNGIKVVGRNVWFDNIRASDVRTDVKTSPDYGNGVFYYDKDNHFTTNSAFQYGIQPDSVFLHLPGETYCVMLFKCKEPGALIEPSTENNTDAPTSNNNQQ